MRHRHRQDGQARRRLRRTGRQAGASIPFSIVAALIGHVIMGYDLSVMSMMGIVALSGVVVNEALILIELANRCRNEGVSPFRAVHGAGVRRLRPIPLTTLTTLEGWRP